MVTRYNYNYNNSTNILNDVQNSIVYLCTGKDKQCLAY